MLNADLNARVVEETEAMAWAHQVANNAPISLDWVKKALRVTWDRDIGSMMDLEVDGMLASLASADLVEGLRSFAEGRPAKYEGR